MCALSALNDNFNTLAHTEKLRKESERERAELLKAVKHTLITVAHIPLSQASHANR